MSGIDFIGKLVRCMSVRRHLDLALTRVLGSNLFPHPERFRCKKMLSDGEQM